MALKIGGSLASKIGGWREVGGGPQKMCEVGDWPHKQVGNGRLRLLPPPPPEYS